MSRTGRYVRVQLAGTNSLALAEVQVWGQAAKLEWLVTDHLGTPRIIADKTGSTAGVSRHDYLPFGEELFAGTGGRTSTQGYTANDGVRQRFTQQERDDETGLDYMHARYYASMQGRFASPDTLLGSIGNPQSLNRYAYVGNNPVNLSDPTGHVPSTSYAGPASILNPNDQDSLLGAAGALPERYENARSELKAFGDAVKAERDAATDRHFYEGLDELSGPQNSCPNCISNAVAGSIGTSRGIIEAVGPNGPTGLAVHDGDHVLSGPGGPAAVTTLGPLAGTVIRTGNRVAPRAEGGV